VTYVVMEGQKACELIHVMGEAEAGARDARIDASMRGGGRIGT
jgi:hypothetical protein